MYYIVFQFNPWITFAKAEITLSVLYAQSLELYGS